MSMPSIVSDDIHFFLRNLYYVSKNLEFYTIPTKYPVALALISEADLRITVKQFSLMETYFL